ncbi:MAG: ABC transporter substrate-binding protein [Candidatus Pristimantibacillus lignocellulolyticus]|uniref:ABC transporter substrate-binding protein n=1 Tax=Candidatus Pristimantibacillus lignocellulolyticus TaxID=2994561 RepID=A0A9J6ZFW2_9BACL|nr:MAG: ABC transporter substrate-binding protein [Candidatus Pristimantibacillus lignocellulolyticus]
MRKLSYGTMLLLLSFMLILSACGSNTKSQNGVNNNGSNNEGNVSAGTEDDGPVEELIVAFPIVSSDLSGLQLAEDEMNKITESKIKVRVKFMPINAGEWLQRTNLIFSSSEKLDLTYVHGTMYSNMVAKGMLVPLDDLISEYGNGITASLEPKYLNASKLGGKIYSVPSVRDLAGSYGYTIRKDLVEKHNIDMSAIKTLDDVATVLQLLKEKEPDMVPISTGGTQSFRDVYKFYDELGDNMGVLPNYDNDLKVVNLFETKEYEEFVNRIRDWYQSGYILSDAATNKLSLVELIRSGKVASYIGMQKPGFDAQESKSNGVEVVSTELSPAYSTTSNITVSMWGIPVHTKLPEKAMKFLNLMYEDENIVNLFTWGVEGKHYEKVQDHIIKYPEGQDASSVGFNSLQWMFGNQFKAYVLENNDPDIWTKTAEFNETATPSKALGFIFDGTNVKTEYAAVSNVITEYKLPLETGSVDPAKILPQFIEKLKAAGIDKIVAEKQKQLDEWAKANGVN